MPLKPMTPSLARVAADGKGTGTGGTAGATSPASPTSHITGAWLARLATEDARRARAFRHHILQVIEDGVKAGRLTFDFPRAALERVGLDVQFVTAQLHNRGIVHTSVPTGVTVLVRPVAGPVSTGPGCVKTAELGRGPGTGVGAGTGTGTAGTPQGAAPATPVKQALK